MKRIIFSLLLVLLSGPVAHATVQVCNRFSVDPDKACTVQANCADADPHDIGAGDCETVGGSTVLICNRWSTKAGLVCTVQGDCPDINGADGGVGDCGVPLRATTNYAMPVPGFRYPGPPGAQNFVYQERLFKEQTDTQLALLAPKNNTTLTGTTHLPASIELGGVPITATGTEINYSAGLVGPIQAQINAINAGSVDVDADYVWTGSHTFNGPFFLPVNFNLGGIPVTVTAAKINNLSDTTGPIGAALNLKAPLNSPTLITPTIASLVNMNHNHTNSAGGGVLPEAALNITDITTNNATTAKHGLLWKLSGVVTEFANGQGGFTPAVVDASTTTKGIVELATDGETSVGVAVQGNDARLSNARTPSAHAASHQNGGADEIGTATPTANSIPKAGAGGTLGVGWIPPTITRSADIDTFLEWKAYTGIGGTADATTFLRGDGIMATPAGSGDASTNTSSSVDSELALFSGTTGKIFKQATQSGMCRVTAGVFSAAEPSGDILFNSSNVGTIQANSVALGTDTTGTYVLGATGTANEITVSGTPAEGWTPTFSLATGIDPTKLAGGGVNATRFNYLSTLTQNVQDQIDGKQATITANSIGPTLLDLTATYDYTGPILDNGHAIHGKISSADCTSEDVPASGECANTGDPWQEYYCPTVTDCTAGAGLRSRPIPADIHDNQSLNSAASNGRFILGANSEANATIIACIDNNADGDCTDAGDSSIRCWIDSVLGPICRSYPDGHIVWDIPAGFALIVKGTGGEFERMTSAGIHTYTNVKPIKSVAPMGYGFGTCVYAEGVLNTSKPVAGYFVCGGADTDGIDFDWTSPDSWDAGTLTVEITALSTNATPSGNLVMSCSGQSVRSGDTIANKATTGEQNTATITFATTSKEYDGTTAAITLQGTAAAGAHIYMHCDVDDTLTTTTQMADVKILAKPKVEYAIGSRSDG